MTGEKTIRRELKQEDISKKFYKQYNEILNGKDSGSEESKKNSLVWSITNIADEDRIEVAQRIINRLIFIKMLQAKDVIKKDIIQYVADFDVEYRYFKLKQLFFNVMNTPKIERDSSIDPEFKEIPYLNGGLFNKSEAELNNSEYSLSPEIIQRIAIFLDSFKYADEWDEDSESLDPEILGYIFEMAMADDERSSTGSFYTPREITEYMAEESILSQIVSLTNSKIIVEYVNVKPITKINDLFSKEKMGINQIPILTGVLNEIVLKMKICDNACGSGAFLLAAANVLFLISCRIRDYVGLATRDIVYKKLIIRDCIYGVDLNKKAVEIAKLRLWLWLIGSYNKGDVDPLPNIDYNIRNGNSILGYVDISKFKQVTLTNLDDWSYGDTAVVSTLLKRRAKEIEIYKKLSGAEARNKRKEINEKTAEVKNRLNNSFYQEYCSGIIDFNSFKAMNPFHWGLEFSDVFDRGGFDIIIGNPPYVENKELAPEAKNVYKSLFSSAYKLYDLSVLFMERSYHLLKENGMMTYITTNKFLASDYGIKIREFLMNKTCLDYLIDVSFIRIFKEASAYPIIIGYTKNIDPKNKLFTYPHIEDTSDFRMKLRNKLQTINQDDYRLTDSLIFNISENIEICQKMDNLSNVHKIGSMSCQFVYRPFGFTDWDSKVEEFVYEETPNSVRVIGTPNISRFHINNEKMRLAKKSIEIAFLERDHILLSEWDKISQDQIYIKEVSKGLSVCRNYRNPYAHLTGIYGLYFEKGEDLDFITGLLNSDLINFYYGSYYGQIHLSGGYWKINSSYIKSLPIRKNNEALMQKISTLSKQLSELDYNSEKSDDSYNQLFVKLNKSVYELYEITEDEIVCIEEYIKSVM